MKKTVKVKKKNPQDATLRNIRALKARVKVLEDTTVILARVLGLMRDDDEKDNSR